MFWAIALCSMAQSILKHVQIAARRLVFRVSSVIAAFFHACSPIVRFSKFIRRVIDREAFRKGTLSHSQCPPRL